MPAACFVARIKPLFIALNMWSRNISSLKPVDYKSGEGLSSVNMMNARSVHDICLQRRTVTSYCPVYAYSSYLCLSIVFYLFLELFFLL